MSVASEAMQWEKAHAIVDIFKNQHDISPDSTTFKNLIRMHIFMSDINGCMERFQEMKSRGISPDRETYGLIVATLTHRDDLVKAVQVLEEADENGIQISNRHIKKLRARFNKLNIRHPNIFPDPNLWVKDLRIVRENKKNARTGNKLQYLNSLTFL
jgi:pentatricopeptide repeat protein